MEVIAKGIDDALRSGISPTVESGDSAFEKIEEIYTDSIKIDPTLKQKELLGILAKLDSLPEKAKDDHGLLFELEILEAATKLFRYYKTEWARLYRKLKDNAVPVRDFSKCIRDQVKKEIQDANNTIAYEDHQVFENLIDGLHKIRSKKYDVENGKIVHNRQTQDGVVPTPLCNFSAQITAEEVLDDGAEKILVYSISGALSDGTLLSSIRVSATNFQSLNWLSQWGCRPIVYSGQGTKDHLRVAVQTLSPRVERRTVYGHIGWREVDDTWVYLHNSGAIGADSSMQISVSPPDGNLENFQLPEPPTGERLKRSVLASLKLVAVTAKPISHSLFAATYRAVLAEILAIDHSIFLSGQSGSQKTELSAIVQSHFGEKFNRLNLPANWTSTENTLERQAFLAKDAILVIDDFAPSASASAVQMLHQKAERILRAQGNKSGRGRMRSDGSLRPANPPRGLVLSSGEDIPKGHSLRARTFTLEVERGSVDLKILTDLQNHAVSGDLANAMSGFIAYVGKNFEALKKEMPQLQRDLRSRATESSMHSRTPELAASLFLGSEMFGRFCVVNNIMSGEEKNKFCSESFNSIMEAARQQSEHQASEESTQKFCELLRAAFSSGMVYVVDSKTGLPPKGDAQLWGWYLESTAFPSHEDQSTYLWKTKGTKIGWIEGDELLLLLEPTYSAIQRLAKDHGGELHLTKNTLAKRLVEKGIVRKCLTEDKNVTKRTVQGARVQVLVISDKELIVQSEASGRRVRGPEKPPLSPLPTVSEDTYYD